MLIIPIPIFINSNIKTKDIPNYLKRIQVINGFLFGGFAIIMGFVFYVVYPQLTELYKSFELPLPIPINLIEILHPIFIIISVLLSIYYFMKKPNENIVNELLEKYKDKESINIKELKDVNKSRIDTFVFIYLLFSVILVAFSIIYPIYKFQTYQITSS